MRPAARAFFLPARPGQRFCLLHAPSGMPRGAVAYVHPWAEEMNKSRRMAAQQARALAEAGYAVLQIDLHGCGDSSDDLEQASWRGWVDDVRLAARCLHDEFPQVPLWIWGLRAGGLLAAQAAAALDSETSPTGLLLWQPPANGKLLLQQFLRLLTAAGLQQGEAKPSTEAARRELAEGRCVDVAGYRLPPALAAGLESATLEPPKRPMKVVWLELSTRSEPELLPASLPRIEAWRAAGHAVTAHAVRGPAFWQTQEIEDAPELIEATLAALSAAEEG